MRPIRVAEVLAAVSLTTDLASGVPFEKGLRTCVVATARSAVALGLDEAERRRCSTRRCCGRWAAPARRRRTRRCSATTWRSRPRSSGSTPAIRPCSVPSWPDSAAWAGPDRPAGTAAPLRRHRARRGSPRARAGCEVSRALGPRLGLAPAAVTGRWTTSTSAGTGSGIPDGRSGDAAVPGGADRARRRAGGVRLRRAAAGRAVRGGRAAGPAGTSTRTWPPASSPTPTRSSRRWTHRTCWPRWWPPSRGRGRPWPPDRLDRLCAGAGRRRRPEGPAAWPGTRHTSPTSPTRRPRSAGRGTPERAALHAAALLHDLGRAGGVQRGVGPGRAARPGRLGAGAAARLLDRPDPARCPALAALAEVAAGHHERCDGSGYHRGVRAGDLAVRRPGCWPPRTCSPR